MFKIALILVGFGLASSVVVAQEKPESPPKDSNAILLAGSRHNGLGFTTGPWHLKVEYHVFDSDGDEIGSGTFEEFWVSAKQNKRIYDADNLHQTDITNEAGVFRSGDMKSPNWTEMRARTEFVEPLAIHRPIEDFRLEKSTTSIGKVSMECVTLIAKNAVKVRILGYDEKAASPHYCFSPDRPMLRFKSDGAAVNEVIYNDIVSFNGVYVARDVQINMLGKPRLKLHLMALDSAPALAADYSVPPEAKNTGNRLTVDPAIMGRQTIKRIFPEASRTGDVHGKVNVHIAVGTDGHVISVTAVDGPESLRQPVIDAVLQWTFEPYLVDGKRVEVETEFAVNIGH